MDTPRDEAQEALLRDIIAEGSDALSSMFLNDNDGLEGVEAGYGDRTMEKESHDQDGSGNRDDGSGDRTESSQVYILVKPMLTS